MPLTLGKYGTEDADGTPQTGDESHLVLWTILLSLSLAGTGMILFLKKRIK